MWKRGEFLSILGRVRERQDHAALHPGRASRRPTSGEVLVDGENIAAASEKRRAILRRTKIGFVFQFFNLAPYLNVEQNILVPVLLNGKGKRSVEKELDDPALFCGAFGQAHRDAGQAFGRANSSAWRSRAVSSSVPDIILLDEPTGNLDSVNSEGIMQLLSRINSEFGTTVIQVTHNEHNAEYGSRTIYIKDGKIVSSADNL